MGVSKRRLGKISPLRMERTEITAFYGSRRTQRMSGKGFGGTERRNMLSEDPFDGDPFGEVVVLGSGPVYIDIADIARA